MVDSTDLEGSLGFLDRRSGLFEGSRERDEREEAEEEYISAEAPSPVGPRRVLHVPGRSVHGEARRTESHDRESLLFGHELDSTASFVRATPRRPRAGGLVGS